ncbi:CaiF/GrlA family transcriptional regulator [Salmonella enterica subsp. enterica serovar Oslo]|nr:CaiF/GrlA family transcriptional regulator [Salmonella enterica subsp. enterica serovar Oslo]
MKNKDDRQDTSGSTPPVNPSPTAPGQVKSSLAQSNHDAFRIPPGLEKYAAEPLYILVALWCQREHRWVTRNDLMLAFSLSERRASHQISYITRRKEVINCRLRSRVPPGRHRPLHEVWVETVTLTRARLPVTPAKKARKQRLESEDAGGPRKLRVGNGDRDMWRWLLRRGCPGNERQE